MALDWVKLNQVSRTHGFHQQQGFPTDQMTKTFSLDIDPTSARHGWMDCWLVVDGQRHHLDATSVFPPFRDLLQLARALGINQLPHEIYWDEEGHGARFQALPIAPNSSEFRLLINHDGEKVVEAEFDRQQIMRGLLESLRKVALDSPGAASEWEFPYFLIEDFEAELAQGFAVSVAEALTRRVHFVFYHCGGYGGVEHPIFALWVGSHYALQMDLEDKAQLWYAWFSLLEKIKRGAFPFEQVVEHYNEVGEEGIIRLPWYRSKTSYTLEGMPDERFFRLVVTAFFPESAPEKQPSVLMNVILERYQFVEAFLQAFQEFLEMDYLAFLASGDCEFDLRTLPLDQLI